MTIVLHPAATTARNAGPGLLPYMDTGTGVARLRVYPAPRRASPVDAPGATMIVELALLKPSATVDASGVMTLRPGGPGMNQVTDTGAWATLVNGDGSVVLDCDVSVVGGAGDIWLSGATPSGLVLYEGGETAISGGVLS